MAPAQSPEVEMFTTPPTTPVVVSALEAQAHGRSSRPSSLRIQHSSGEWTPDLIVDTNSSQIINKSPLTAPVRDTAGNPSNNQMSHGQTSTSREGHQSNTSQAAYKPPLKSPCFVHSLLDKGASLQDWLQQSKTSGSIDFGGYFNKDTIQSKRPLSPPMYLAKPVQDSPPLSSQGDEDEDDFDGSRSLTLQLAETAVSVREMSKQLGRARVKANIQSVMIITKARDNRLIKLTRELALYLMLTPRSNGRGLIVYVDPQLRNSKRFDAEGIKRDYPELFVPTPKRRTSSNNSVASLSSELSYRSKDEPQDVGLLRYWTTDMCSRSPQLFDFVVTLGGDGTVLFTSWLFQRIVPPVLPFALGSLGFLTNFDFADHRAVMDSAIEAGIRVNLRMRFTCTVYRAVAQEEGKGRKAVKKAETGEIIMKNIEKGGWEALEGGWAGASGNTSGRDKEIMCFTTRPVESFEVLNELVVDRGPSPYVSLLELFGDEHHMTTVQADGLTVSTPTGSTAYSLSAGGSLVHPEIPALLITPICPHTLSFRPMLLPDSMELRICVPYNSRSTAWASFDGRGRVELKQGDHIKVTASRYPFPTVCADKQSTDWFHAISRTLKWNERERQKSFVVVEEGPARPRSKKVSNDLSTVNSHDPVKGSSKEIEGGKADDGDGSEDEEEQFDIDSTENGSPPDVEEKLKAEQEQKEIDARIAANAMMRNGGTATALRSRSREGYASPDRFAGPIPHPPKLSPRHVPREKTSPELSTSWSLSSGDRRLDEDGARDHIHSPRTAQESSKSKIPRDRDVEAESAKTPRASDHPHHGVARKLLYHGHGVHLEPVSEKRAALTSYNHTQRRRSFTHHGTRPTRSLSVDGARCAFAVWGHDESDSNASDSDSAA